MRRWNRFANNLAGDRQCAMGAGAQSCCQSGAAILALVLALLLLPVCVSSDCTPPPYGFRGYSFLSPNIVDKNVPSAPIFLDIAAIYEYFGGQKVAQERDNIAEWHERYCRQAKQEDIREFIYNTPTSELELLRSEMQMKKTRLAPATGNSFVRYLRRHRCVEMVDYLLFAKSCEPHVTLGSDPWKTPPRDTIAMEQLIDRGLAEFRLTKSHYLRLRYAYQIIRLAHYARRYSEVLSLYDFLMPQIDADPSIIKYWIEGHRAGAMMSLGRNVEASYLFSLVFENCPSKAESAFRSFRIRTDEEWLACEKLCQSDRERATLYALRAKISDSKALEEMRKIYELDPLNRHLEILLVNEIRRLEKDWLGYSFNDQRAHNRRLGYPRPNAEMYLLRLQEFVQQVLREGQVARPELWRISLGHLFSLAGNYYDAARTFERAKDQVQDRALREQLAAFEMAMRISAFTVVTDSVEQMVNEMRKSELFYKYASFPDFISDKMKVLYEQGNSPGKAFLSNYRFRDLKANPQIAIIDDLLAVCRKTGRNSLETAMITKSDGTTIEKDLLNLKATLLFSEGKLEEALKVFKEMDRTFWNGFGVFNPFIPYFKDCVSCGRLPDTINMYNRGELIERLLDMEALVMRGSNNAADLCFDLGVAYYNMTYFSYEWRAMDLFRSGSSLAINKLRVNDVVIPHPNFPLGNREVFDCSRALYFFERARQLSTDPEKAARAAYWAAKCERNAWYINRVRGAQRTYDYFAMLKNNYAQTRFYERVLRECKTFKTYLAK